MRRLIGLVGLLTIAGTLTAKAAGPVYTIPADYEKMKKVIEGLAGTTNLNALSDTQARNAGANVKSFVEGATGRSTTSTYSPSYFRAYGNNYRQFVANAAATDPGATTNAARFTNAGRNYRNLAQGMTGLGITDSRYYYYGRAGTNVRNLAEGETGLSIRDWRYWYFRNAGQNINTTVRKIGISGWTSNYSWSVATTSNWTVSNNVSQFKQRADQVFYDTYINPNGLKKTFSSLSSAVTTKTAGLTPITRYNRVSGLGGDNPSGKIVAVGNLSGWSGVGVTVSNWALNRGYRSRLERRYLVYRTYIRYGIYDSYGRRIGMIEDDNGKLKCESLNSNYVVVGQCALVHK